LQPESFAIKQGACNPPRESEEKTAFEVRLALGISGGGSLRTVACLM
jgi:hypothetical protein